MTYSTGHKGFSLIELMIVVAIIGILATLAIPSYQQYTLRARFAEVISATQPYKLAISLALQEGITLNEISNETADLPPPAKPTKHLDSITITHGVITATATSLVKNATYILTPDENGNTWSISGSCLKEHLCHA